MFEYLKSNPSVVVALTAVVGVIITALITFKNNNKNVLIKTVTEERAKWRDDLRELAACFIKETHSLMKRDTKNIEELYEIKAKIVFRLNPDKNHHLDHSLLVLINRIVDNIKKPTMYKMLVADLARFEIGIQSLIKKEWDKSKKEAKTGKLDK